MKTRKKILSLLLTAALAWTLVPAFPPAAQAESADGIIDMSDVSPPVSGDDWTYANDVYTVTGDVTVTGDNGGSQRRIVVDGAAAASITLNNASITGIAGSTGGQVAPIYLNSGAELTLILAEGTVNTLTGSNECPGIYTTDATLIIAGVGTLDARGAQSWPGIGGNPNGTVIIESGAVNATGGDGAAGIGGSRNSGGGTITITGGVVNATGGIGAGYGASGGSLILDGNGVVFATSVNVSDLDQRTGGLLFEGDAGTVYGTVAITDDVTVPNGKSLTIPDGSELTVPNGKTLTLDTGAAMTIEAGAVLRNDGAIDGSGDITNAGTIYNAGTIDISVSPPASGLPGTVINAPIITTGSLPGGTVGSVYSQTLTATGGGAITWMLAGRNSALPDGLSLDSGTGVISGTPVAAGTSDFTVEAVNAAGSATKPLSITIDNPRGSGGSSGGGSASSPTVDANNGAARVSYEKSGETAILSLPASKISEIARAAREGAARIDLSSVSGVTAARMPNAALTAFADAGLNVEINLPDASLTMSAAAARDIAAQMRNSDITVSARTVPLSALNAAQRAALNDGDVVLDVTVQSDAVTVRGFDGEVTVASPYSGRTPAGVWYLSDSGGREKMESSYAGSRVSFNATHLSLYVFGYDEPAANLAEEPPAPEEPSAAFPFEDVKAGDWYYDDAAWAYGQGLMSGASINPPLFAPNAPMTRAMLVTVLYRFAGEPGVRMNMAFDDVKEGAYYYQAVNWAKEFGIVAGVGGDLFAPDAEITREQAAAILLSCAEYLDQGPVGAWAVRLPFDDTDKIADWAMEGAMWSYMNGIISGKPGNLFDPRGTETRAEAAAMLHRLMINVTDGNQ